MRNESKGRFCRRLRTPYLKKKKEKIVRNFCFFLVSVIAIRNL